MCKRAGEERINTAITRFYQRIHFKSKGIHDPRGREQPVGVLRTETQRGWKKSWNQDHQRHTICNYPLLVIIIILWTQEKKKKTWVLKDDEKGKNEKENSAPGWSAKQMLMWEWTVWTRVIWKMEQPVKEQRKQRRLLCREKRVGSVEINGSILSCNFARYPASSTKKW